MAKDNSFDVVSEVDQQEVDNTVNQTVKEMIQRYDFKGSKATVTLEKDAIRIIADDEYKLKSIVDILQTKAIKRGIPLRAFQYGKVEEAAGGTIRQMVEIQRGISKEKGKEVVASIKELKLKVQAQLMDDQVRVTAKDRDDLQAVIQHLKSTDFGVDLQFINYRTF